MCKAADLIKAAQGADRNLIVNVGVFDLYAGPGVPEGKKSVALNVTLQPREKTLTDAEIEAVAAENRRGGRQEDRRDVARLTARAEGGTWREILLGRTADERCRSGGRLFTATSSAGAVRRPARRAITAYFSIDGHSAAGLMLLPDEAKAQGARPSWFGYISTPDVDADVEGHRRRWREGLSRGGNPAEASAASPWSPTRRARLSRCGPISAAAAHADMPPMAPGHVGWHELFTDDVEQRLRLLRGKIRLDQGRGAGYGADGRLPAVPHRRHAGRRHDAQPANIPQPFWNYYFTVPALDAAIAKVEKGGGKIVHDPTEVPGGAWIAQCFDPAGRFLLAGRGQALKRFQAKWIPVRVKNTRKNKKPGAPIRFHRIQRPRLMRLALVFALFFAGAQAASAAADPCAKFSDADAYNDCLALSGPLAGDHKLARAPPEEAHPAAHRRVKPVSAPRRDGLSRKANGRVVQIFRDLSLTELRDARSQLALPAAPLPRNRRFRRIPTTSPSRNRTKSAISTSRRFAGAAMADRRGAPHRDAVAVDDEIMHDRAEIFELDRDHRQGLAPPSPCRAPVRK